MNRQLFYKSFRENFGTLNPSQVQGTEAILNEWDNRKMLDLRQLAYILATTWHETARTMQPIREFGRGVGKKYGTIHYGRGYVQLTWASNYKKMEDLLGYPLLHQPDLALRPDIAAKILFEGMTRGSFTGQKLSDFFNSGPPLWINARRIINGTDRATLIGTHATKFYSALLQAQDIEKKSPYPLLQAGMNGEEIEKFQHMMQIVESSKFDENTEAAVRAFQLKYGLTVDGIVGNETWSTLRNVRGV